MFDSAAEYAREAGLDPKTIRDYIQQGKIKGHRKGKGTHWRIDEKEKKHIPNIQPPYPKHYKHYTKAEIYIIESNMDKSNRTLARMLHRSKNSVKIKKCRLRREQHEGKNYNET